MSRLSAEARDWLNGYEVSDDTTASIADVGMAAARRTGLVHYVAEAAEITVGRESTLAASWLCGGSTVDAEVVADEDNVGCVSCRIGAQVPGQGAKPVVYHAWGEGDALLYVGSSIDIIQRLRSHSRQTRWWPEVRRLTFDAYDSELEARRAEMKAINEHPGTYNREGVPGRYPAPLDALDGIEIGDSSA